jgi:hypothetical protein
VARARASLRTTPPPSTLASLRSGADKVIGMDANPTPDVGATPDDSAADLLAERGPAPEGSTPPESQPREAIAQPAKLLRIASMVRELLEETRAATLDEPGRVRLRQIYERSMSELADVLSPDLQDELATLAPPMQGVPSDTEIRVAQAQLVGWLEGLFHGIQAAMFAQQAAARAQFEELRRRGLPGGPPTGGPGDLGAEQSSAGPGQYL